MVHGLAKRADLYSRQTSAARQELAGTVKENFDSGKHANELAESASKVAIKGGAVVAEWDVKLNK